LLLPLIEAIFFGAEIFNPQKKNLQKLNVFFLDQNRRNFTPQKLPVIRYMVVKILFFFLIFAVMGEIYKYKPFIGKYKYISM
jgi:hypothetical protein